MRAVRESAELWADHVAQCDHCHQNRGLLPKGLLFQACVERRKVKEALAKKEEVPECLPTP